MSIKPKVIILSANAFSGSTIFSLFLGRHPNITNLGEVINLENDYRESLNCTCGNKLLNCSFWQKIKKKIDNSFSYGSLNFNLSLNGKRSPIDKKGMSFKKFLVLLGLSPNIIFGKNEVDNYKIKNNNFFKVVFNHFNNSNYIIDSSKPPERLDILLNSPELDIYCIHLKRDLKLVFDSNIKREKRTRKIIGLKFYRELIMLYLREKHRNAIFKKINKKKKITVDFENFLINPEYEFSRVLNFLSLESKYFNGFDRSLDIKNQHIYVGNRWIFNITDEPIFLKKRNINRIKHGYFKSKLIDLLLRN